MTDWSDLSAELQRWRQLGRAATFWWRDDDAVAASPRLDRLLALARDAGAPLSLAVIPFEAQESLATRLAAYDGIDILCHGWRHLNLAPADDKKAEFTAARPVFEMLGDIALGWERLRLLFGDNAQPVFVPPWNRMPDALVAQLPYAGIAGLSRYGPRSAARSAGGPRECDCHVDLIAWRGHRGFIGDDAALGAIIGHLQARREGTMDPDEPIGLLSHHLVHDEATWRFITALLQLLAASGATHWLSAKEIFNLPA